MITPAGGIGSFMNLFTPKARAEGGEPVYSLTVLFDAKTQKSADFKALEAMAIQCAKDKWGDKVNLATVRMPFLDGNEKAEKYLGYEDTVYISPWTKIRPGVVDHMAQDIIDPSTVWAGQGVRVQVQPFAWTNSGKKGVSFGLLAVMIDRPDMPRLDGRVSANKVFAGLAAAAPTDGPF
jgi:hypothetical protein